MVNTAVAGASNIFVVPDIAARDALAPTVVTQAIVVDATADTSVALGSATYVYDPVGDAWQKIAEHESMDVVLQWANIQGRPTSTAAEIDDAVSKRHSHANLTSLDKVGEDAGGLLQFNGDYVDPALRVAEW
jgi:N-acetylneuraminic acid mutarotase